jgi:hypothetical protein
VKPDRLDFWLLFFACLASGACKRVEEAKKMEGLPRTYLPALPWLEALDSPPFTATVVNRHIVKIPKSDGSGEVDVVAIELKTGDGKGLAITSVPASVEQIAAANRLVVGQAYQFPFALKDCVKSNVKSDR